MAIRTGTGAAVGAFVPSARAAVLPIGKLTGMMARMSFTPFKPLLPFTSHARRRLLRPAPRPMLFALLLGSLVPLGVGGCSDTYYAAWQKLGYEKRDILVSRVEKARDEQNDAKQQFSSTLDEFKSLTNFNGGDLEAEYHNLDASYTACKDEAAAVSKRIASVDKVAQAMFDEWNGELDQYHDQSLRDASAQKLDESKRRYATLLASMKRSEASMQPVLAAFNDRVLFLKHNLNASAISSLSNTAGGIDTNVQDLIKQMNASIDEANAFIDHLKQS